MANFRLWGSGTPLSESLDRASGSRIGGALAKREAPESADGLAAAEALRLLRTFEETQHGWLWSADADGRLTYISDSIARTLDAPGPLLGARLSDLFVQVVDDLAGRRTLPFLLARQSSFEKVTVRTGGTEDQRCWSISGSPQHDELGRFAGFRGSAIDVTEHRRSSEHASQLAKYDPLTGLPNRRRMTEVLDASMTAAEHHRRPCAILLIDLDRFKQVNDTLGHPAGDALLKQVADRLCGIVGDRERVFRLGGDEFQVLLPGVEDRGIIGDLAADIIARLSQPYSVEGSRCNVGASIGVAVAPTDGQTRSDLTRNADLALYASKGGGRGSFRFFSTELLQVAEDRRALEDDLRDALEKGQIRLAYQPIVSARTNRVAGVEALIRWDHPTRGAISPALFIPIAEEAGVIEKLGEWALHKACDDAAGWPGKLRVAVNVSPLQFTSEKLPETVAAALSASGLAPERLELEITEGVFLSQSDATDTMFKTLKGLGVRLALDDFGTGYSSLGYLRTAPFDKIKIDQTFVRAATMPGSRDGAIIAAIVALAEALDMETTAEGIEYMEQLDLIRSLRVSHVQGWVYSKAVPSEELSEHLQTGSWAIEPSGPEKQRSSRQSTYRKIGVIHADRYQSFIMRNISATGALVEGEAKLAIGALVVIDFGDGQLTFARVTRALRHQYGVAFEQQLVDDGNGGLCTSHRVSPYVLSTVGLPSPGEPDQRVGSGEGAAALEQLASRLGLTLAPPRPQAPARRPHAASDPAGADCVPTVRDLAQRYLDTIGADEPAREAARRDIRNHVDPRFGQLRLDEVTDADVADWLAAKGEVTGHDPGAEQRLQTLLAQMWKMAAELKLPGAGAGSAEGSLRFDRRGHGGALLDAAQAELLLDAARNSQNRQLRLILSLLMLTGARPGEVLAAAWCDFDLGQGVWRLAIPGHDQGRDLRLNSAALALLARLPGAEAGPYLVANPVTRKPYRSLTASWEAVRSKTGLGHIDIDDLRYCDLGVAVWEDRLLRLVLDDGPGHRPDDGRAQPVARAQAAVPQRASRPALTSL